MSCNNCPPESTANQVYNLQYSYNTNCTTGDCPNGTLDAKCVLYKSSDLTNSGILTNDNLETALQKIDEKLGEAAGNYSSYNMNCLDPVETEEEFVDLITSEVCDLRSILNNFIDTEFPAYQEVVDNRLTAVEVPGITEPDFGGIATDTQAELFSKIGARLGEITDEIDLTGVDWAQCYGGATPTNIKEGFDLLLDQICETKDLISDGDLPTFNNTGSCLASPGATDSLEDTIIKIRTRVCLSPTFDINALTWGCIEKPSSTTTDLQSAFQSVLSEIDTLSENAPTFSEDFTVENVDDENPCLGKVISLATPLNQDRFVASTALDASPGTLIDKLEEGDGIGLDSTTTPGKIIISADASSNGTVYAGVGDTVLGVLEQKIQGKGSDDGILSIGGTYNVSTKKLDLKPSIDTTLLLEALFTLLETDTELKERFCTIVNSCPSGCTAPQNAQATYIGESV